MAALPKIDWTSLRKMIELAHHSVSSAAQVRK